MKRIRAIFLSALLFLTIGVIVFVFWAKSARGPEPAAYSAALADPSVLVQEREGFLTIRPRSAPLRIGLLFYPGLRVAPEAYVAKLVAISAASGMQIVIGRPHLNIAALSINQANAMRHSLPDVTRWYVGGHSLGGATACLYASHNPNRLEGVMLFGTYCGSNISNTNLRVLDITGENDGVIPPAKVLHARAELPSNAVIAEIPGMNHGQLGNYGPQRGDHSPSISDEMAAHRLADVVKAFLKVPTL